MTPPYSWAPWPAPTIMEVKGTYYCTDQCTGKLFSSLKIIVLSPQILSIIYFSMSTNSGRQPSWILAYHFNVCVQSLFACISWTPVTLNSVDFPSLHLVWKMAQAENQWNYRVHMVYFPFLRKYSFVILIVQCLKKQLFCTLYPGF